MGSEMCIRDSPYTATIAAAAAAAAAALPRAEDPRFDRAIMPTYLARDYHPAANPWSVLPADGSVLANSAKYWKIWLHVSLWELCTSSVSVCSVRGYR